MRCAQKWFNIYRSQITSKEEGYINGFSRRQRSAARGPFRSRIIAVIIAFIINYAAYFSEIYRGGIESIPVGQYEAGQVLGLTKTQTFFKVVLFQVVKRIMAPMSNEVITLVKDTSLANVIAVGELIMSAQNIVKVYAIIGPLFYTAIFYLIFCGVLTLLFNALEKKLNYYRG